MSDGSLLIYQRIDSILRNKSVVDNYHCPRTNINHHPTLSLGQAFSRLSTHVTDLLVVGKYLIKIHIGQRLWKCTRGRRRRECVRGGVHCVEVGDSQYLSLETRQDAFGLGV